jgi:hypothetical protein
LTFQGNSGSGALPVFFVDILYTPCSGLKKHYGLYIMGQPRPFPAASFNFAEQS